jgi:3-dehydroquinate synthetase
VDSSVGGKTAVNHPLGKNMLGAFYQPKAVAIGLDALSTLPDKEFLAGLAEVLKYGVIRDEAFFRYLEDNAAGILARKPEALKEIVARSCAIKAEVVGKDERETAEGGRAILNYGHTFGHAFEVLGGYGLLPHGLAVALGMRVAARLAAALGMLAPEAEARQNALLDRLGMPKAFPKKLDESKAWDAMGLDKKVDAGSRVYILPTRIGEVVPVRDVSKEAVLLALSCVRYDNGRGGPGDRPALGGQGPAGDRGTVA